MTWDELYKKIEKDLFSSMSENTAKSYLADIKMFEFSDKPCRAAVERKRKEWQDKGLSGKTIQRRFAAVRWVLDMYPREFGLDDILDIKSAMKHVDINNKEMVYATKEQADKVISMADERTALCVAMMFYEGMRRDEVYNNRLQDWDIKGEDTLNGGVPAIIIPRTKNDEPRRVPLAQQTIDCFLRYVNGDRVRNARLIENVSPKTATYTILSTYGRLRRESIQRDVKKASIAAGFPQLHCHSYRHGLATLLAKSGRDSIYIATMMGHKNLNTTRRYIHLSPADLKKGTEDVLK